MIKAPTKAASARPAKPRPKKPAATKHGDANDDGDGDSVAGGDTAKPAESKQQKAKRRRSAPKKKETDSDGAEGHKERGLPVGLQFLQRIQDDQRYERAPRLLPDITGVKSLSLTEINSDIKYIQSALSVFEAKVTALLPPGSTNALNGSAKASDARAFDIGDDDDAAYSTGYGFKPRRARPNGVITPEEIVESLPVCRRAVRITQRELAVMKRERDDLERDFMRMRCKYVYQVSEMKKMQKQQDRITRVLSRDVVKIAKSLESSRRRTNALQDIMTELETRGNGIVRLTREKRQMELLLKKHDVALPEIEELYVGDRVKCSLGVGHVHSMDEDTRILALDMEDGGRAFVQEDEVEVFPVEITYLDVERELKQSFFEKIGALVQPNGRFGIGGRQRGELDAVGGGGDLDSDDEEDDESDEDSDDDDEDSEGSDDENTARKKTADGENPKQKKRKFTMMTAASSGASGKKKQKQVRLIEYPACTIPITPYDMGLLLSPLSTLPDQVAAVGPSALQWKDSYLPSRMHEWEQERYESLQMKGEIERLRFQLQKAEAEKLDAQQHASDQLESINQLVTQLDKLRESMSTGNGGSSSSSAHNHSAGSQCPNCGTSSANGSRKNSTTSVKSSKGSSSKPSHKKDATSQKRQHGESIDDDGLEEPEKTDRKSRKESSIDDESGEATELQQDAAKDSKDANDDDADAAADSSDGASSKPATRSLRPRRKPTSNSTTASPKQSK